MHPKQGWVLLFFKLAIVFVYNHFEAYIFDKKQGMLKLIIKLWFQL